MIRPSSDLQLLDSIDGIMSRGAPGHGSVVVIDLSEVDYLSSSALAKMMQLRRWLDVARGRLVLRRLSPELDEIFRITRLDRVFQIEG
jgi:anti-sigma B factor antagonist